MNREKIFRRLKEWTVGFYGPQEAHESDEDYLNKNFNTLMKEAIVLENKTLTQEGFNKLEMFLYIMINNFQVAGCEIILHSLFSKSVSLMSPDEAQYHPLMKEFMKGVLEKISPTLKKYTRFESKIPDILKIIDKS